MKCMIITHLPMSYKSNTGKTLASMFSCWSRDDLSQIYINDVSRDYELCSSFFLIDEKKMLKKTISLNVTIGEEMFMDSQSFTVAPTLKMNSNIKFIISRMNVILLWRNFAWCNKKWKSNELDSWVKKNKPDVIFLIPGYIMGLVDCALYIAEKYNLPVATFVMDDYFIRETSINPFANMLNALLNKKYRELIEKADLHYVIGEKMADAYNREFSCKHIPIMNWVDTNKIYSKKVMVGKCVRLAYFGGLGIGRFASICQIAEVVGDLNLSGRRVFFELYTKNLTESEIKRFESNEGCRYRGYVIGSKLDKAMDETDILVHIESFSRRYKKILSTAVSTKIPEYMNSGRFIFVYGPEYSESIRIIQQNNCGIGVTQKDNESIKYAINRIINDKDLYYEYVRNAKQFAKEKFSVYKNSRRLKKQIYHMKETYVQQVEE